MFRKLFTNSGVVVGVDVLSPRLVAIRIQSSALHKTSFSAGDKVKLAPPGASMRSYTPAWIEPESGTMAITFHRHDGGPIGRWASSVQIGDAVSFIGPVRSLDSKNPGEWGLFFGDETTLGLARALGDGLGDRPFGGALEFDARDVEAASAFGVDLQVVARRTRGEALIEAAEATLVPHTQGTIWIAGHARTTRAVREVFISRGVDPRCIRVKPYWSDRGHAHRKSVSRAMG